jgi:hypothetical protein
MFIFLSLDRLSKKSVQFWDPSWYFVTNVFLGRGVGNPTPNPKLGGHPLSAVRDCLFNIFVVAPHMCWPFPPSATRGRAMPCLQGTHLMWRFVSYPSKLIIHKLSHHDLNTDSGIYWTIHFSTCNQKNLRFFVWLKSNLKKMKCLKHWNNQIKQENYRTEGIGLHWQVWSFIFSRVIQQIINKYYESFIRLPDLFTSHQGHGWKTHWITFIERISNVCRNCLISETLLIILANISLKYHVFL